MWVLWVFIFGIVALFAIGYNDYKKIKARRENKPARNYWTPSRPMPAAPAPAPAPAPPDIGYE